MRPIALALALLLLAPATLAEEEKGGGPPKKKRPPPPPGIRWEADLQKGLDRAAREGRPILLAVNALENEQANNHLAMQLYRSPAWGEASRGYAAFVCNPNTHGSGTGNTCSRYPGCNCKSHRDALDFFLKLFGQDLISPQHVILEPDGDVAYRKQYFTGVVGPKLLDTYLSNLAPKSAYARAGISRAAKIKQLAGCPVDDVESLAGKWLDGSDGLAAAGLVNVLDDAYDAARRKAVIRALRNTPALQVPVLLLAAEERVLYPDDEPAETRLWLESLFVADRKAGVWGATRVLVRLGSESERDAVLRIWAGRSPEEATAGIDALPKTERAAAFEALILAEDRRASDERMSQAWTEGRVKEILRAKNKRSSGVRIGGPELRLVLREPNPRKLRPAIIGADLAELRTNLEPLIKLLASAPWERVRIAVALRLLQLRNPVGGAVVKTLMAAIGDPIEGPETRSYALQVLGTDPGQSTAEWQRVLTEYVAGGGK